MTVKERYRQVIDWFRQHRPVAETELEYTDPYSLLVAVILSAQCTDKRVNMVTPALLARYPTPLELARATPDEVFTYIRSISYPNNKAKHLAGMAQMLSTDFGNIVPSDVNELQRLPGVGRKTANVIASVVHGLPAMAVDTHVHRVSARLGLTKNAKTPLATERQLVANIPEEHIAIAHHWLILHGRYTCTARSPRCHHCGLSHLCPEFAKQKKSVTSA